MTLQWRTHEPLHPSPSGICSIASGPVVLPIGEATSVELVALLAKGATEDQLLDSVLDTGTESLTPWLAFMDRLVRSGRATPQVSMGDDVLVALEACREPPMINWGTEAISQAVRLSEYAVVRSEHGRLTLENPLSSFVAFLGGPIAALLPTLAAQWVQPSHYPDEVATALGVLASADLLARLDAEPDLTFWEPHDLYFHWRTRKGNHRYPMAATFSMRDKCDPLPVVKPVPDGQFLPLEEFVNAEFSARPFSSVMANRRSTRQCPKRLTMAQLATFLHTHRILRVSSSETDPNVEYPQSSRLYPGGGAMYEVDLYLTTRGVGQDERTIEGGVWWFDPMRTGLVNVSRDASLVESVMADAEASTGGMANPEAVMTYTARIGRNSWKYSSMAYRLVLLHAGVLYQHAYMVGSALDMGICGLGNGTTSILDRGLDLDLNLESAVAELILTGSLS